MNKINERVEQIFSHAVAMEQSGKMRSTIYCLDKEVFVMNAENTVLLRFPLRKSETSFKAPVSFKANDYDSRRFMEENGKIVFVTENEHFVRKKSCSTPGDTPETIKGLFAKFDKFDGNTVKINRSVIGLLDDALSHIEISAPEKELFIVQRNIYSGAVIELKRKSGGGFGLVAEDDIEEEFGPIGIRTNDFLALFSFIDSIRFSIPSGDVDYCHIKGVDPKMPMEGIIATCIYDELGGVEASRKGDNNGRKEQKKRRSERSADPATDQGREVRRKKRPQRQQ